MGAAEYRMGRSLAVRKAIQVILGFRAKPVSSELGTHKTVKATQQCWGGHALPTVGFLGQNQLDSYTGPYLRLIDFLYHSTLGLRIIKKKTKSIRAWHMKMPPLTWRGCLNHTLHTGVPSS